MSKFRFWLIRKLVGNNSCAINMVYNKPIMLDGCKSANFYNCKFEVEE